jgi:ABC-type glutathione transport system ATPase component
VTHQTQWLHACDRVLVMRHGAIVADGPWATLAADPSLPELQQAAEATLADADIDAMDADTSGIAPEACDPLATSAADAHSASSSGRIAGHEQDTPGHDATGAPPHGPDVDVLETCAKAPDASAPNANTTAASATDASAVQAACKHKAPSRQAQTSAKQCSFRLAFQRPPSFTLRSRAITRQRC